MLHAITFIIRKKYFNKGKRPALKFQKFSFPKTLKLRLCSCQKRGETLPFPFIGYCIYKLAKMVSIWDMLEVCGLKVQGTRKPLSITDLFLTCATPTPPHLNAWLLDIASLNIFPPLTLAENKTKQNS